MAGRGDLKTRQTPLQRGRTAGPDTVDPSFPGSALENVAGLALPAIHVDATTADHLATDVTEVTPCGEENDRVLPAQTVPDTQTFEACRTLTAGSGFGVGATGDVALRAGEKVILEDGFSVESGGSLTIEIDPTLAGE